MMESLIHLGVSDITTIKSMCATVTVAEYRCLTWTTSSQCQPWWQSRPIKYPRDIDFDCQGNCYVVDYKKDQILVFNEDAQYLHPFDQGMQEGNSKILKDFVSVEIMRM